MKITHHFTSNSPSHQIQMPFLRNCVCFVISFSAQNMCALDIRLTILYKLIFTNNKSFQLLYIVLFQWTVLKWSGDLDFYMPVYPLFSQSESSLEKVERFLWADCQQITEIWIWDQRKTIRNLAQLFRILGFLHGHLVRLQYLIHQQSIH